MDVQIFSYASLASPATCIICLVVDCLTALAPGGSIWHALDLQGAWHSLCLPMM